jgi:hypothetical protein
VRRFALVNFEDFDLDSNHDRKIWTRLDWTGRNALLLTQCSTISAYSQQSTTLHERKHLD